MTEASEVKKHDLVYFCDGGCLNNGTPEAKAYGSWKCVTNGKKRRYEFTPGEASTGNKAEYLTLTKLLMAISERLHEMPNAPIGKFSIFMDSMLVVNQVHGTWQVNEESLLPYRADVLRLLKEISRKGFQIELTWAPREKVFEVLGH